MASSLPRHDRVTSIYTLVDPRDGLVKYVGKTVNVSKRKSSYRNPKDNTRCSNWIKHLISLNFAPEFKIIDEVVNNWADAERGYITLYKSLGANLYNHTPGGESGCLNYKRTQEEKDRIGLSQKGVLKSKEHNKNVSDSLKRKYRNDPVYASLLRARLLKNSQNMTKESKAKSLKNRLNNPNWKKAVIESCKKRRSISDKTLFESIKLQESKIMSLRKYALMKGINPKTLQLAVCKYRAKNIS